MISKSGDKKLIIISVFLVFLLFADKTSACTTFVISGKHTADGKPVRQVRPASIMLTAYSTTLLADGEAHTMLRIAVTDSSMHEIASAGDSIRIYMTGEGKLKAADGRELVFLTDTASRQYAVCSLEKGIEGVEAVDPKLPVMLHLALGGQNEEAVFWLDNMIARGVKFDIIGLSYYPRWHGTLENLKFNLNDLLKRYHKPLNVVEYSDFKREVNDIIFALPGGMGKGACIWEPLNSWSGLFDRGGATTQLIRVYDDLKTFIKN